MTSPAARPRRNATPSWQQCLGAGMTAQEAAEARGVSYRAATLWAQRNNVRFYGYSYGRPQSDSGKLILGLYQSGAFTKAEIARLLDCSHANVRQVIAYHGAAQ